MKKLMIAAAIVCAATFANAATVGWTNLGLASQNGNAYDVFVIGAKGVTSIAQISGIIAAGNDVSSYVFGGGNVTSGAASQNATIAGAPTLGEGTWTSFYVVFNDDNVADATKFVVISGATGQTKEVGSSTGTITFNGGNASGKVTDPDNWQNIPEPTSGLLLLLGVAGLALRRRRA